MADARASPAGRLPPQDWMRAAATRKVVAALEAEGAEVRFVGGCVRDALAGRPVQDVDIATHLPPETVMRLLRDAGIKAIPTGLEHGTVTAVAKHKPFEITTLREDVETYGRRAKVAFTDDWTADAARRDFTFNALSCAPDGTLYDPFGGIDDLRAGRVRFVGDARARIEEDYLRLLRFFRFQAHYGLEPPDPAVLDIAETLAPKLERLSGERVREELFKLLQAPDPVPVVEVMLARRILDHILPVVSGTALLGAVLRAEDPREPVDPVLRLAALIVPDRAQAEAAATRLRLSNKQRFALVNLADPPIHPDRDASAKERHRIAHKLRAPLYRTLVRLTWARRHADEPERVPGENLKAMLAEADWLAAKVFPVHGRDAIKLGVREGPELGRLLDAVEAWWADRDFAPSRAACLDKLRELIAEGTDGGEAEAD